MTTQSMTKSNVANDTGSVEFKCPRCLEQNIIRSRHERSIVARYTCPRCGFTGPN